MNYGWRRGINCPICGGLRKDCRQSLRTNLIHCRVLDTTPRDYIYLREDAEGFGMWQHRDDRSSWVKEQSQLSEEEREQKRLERLQAEKERERAEQEKYAQSLSVEERDREIRKILNQLFLWPSHEKALRDRFSVLGLEVKEIDRLIAEAGYKSVRQWQKLDQPVDDRLPGVRLGGLSLLIPGDGILIPIKNESGLYIGLQVRLDNPKDGNKYPWLAGERKRVNRPSSKLRNGELPLSLHLPKTKSIDPGSIVIGLAEGVGFKPQIAAERLGIPFIGASGGHFAKSPELLRNYLDFLLTKHSVTNSQETSVEDINSGKSIRDLNNNPKTNPQETSVRNIDSEKTIKDLNNTTTKSISAKNIYSGESIINLNNQTSLQNVTIVLFADGGSPKNPTTLKIYSKTVELLESWGFKVKIGWWGQLEKLVGDIDEIKQDILPTTTYISWSEFLEFSKPVETLLVEYRKHEEYWCPDCGASGDGSRFVKEFDKLSLIEKKQQLRSPINKKLDKQQKQEKRKQYLSIARRDREIRHILAQLPLTEQHKWHLKQNLGLSDELIVRRGYRSVKKWQKLIGPADDLLAGVKLGGKSLLTPADGIIAPIPNHKGEFVSWQFHFDNPIEDRTYLWAAGERSRSPRPSSHLPWKELPLSVDIPDKLKNNDTVGLCSGVDYRPQLASDKLNIPFIGADKGRFANSPITLKLYLKKLGRKKITLFPAPGAVYDRPQLINYYKTINEVEKLGYKIAIAWWNQLKKSAKNLHELDDKQLDEIKYLTPAEFRSLAGKEQYKKECWSIWHDSKKFTPDIIINQKYFRHHLPESGTFCLIKSPLGSGKTTELIRWLRKLARQGFGIINLGYRNTLLIQFCSKANQKDPEEEEETGEGRGENNFEADSSNSLSRENNADSKLSLKKKRRPETGEGENNFKTDASNSLFRENNADSKLSQLPSPTSHLKDPPPTSPALFEPLGFYHLLEDRDSGTFLLDPQGKIAGCVNSIIRFKPEDFDGKIIVIDEIVSVIKHMLYSGTIKHFSQVISLFEEAIRRADRVICLDGFNADWVGEYLTTICPRKRLVKIENKYVGDKPKVNYLEGSIDIENQKIKKNDRSPWLELLLNNSAIPAICSDSQVFIEAMDELLSAKGVKTLRADSKTAPTKEIKEFLKDPETYIRQHKIEAILYTPTAESGLDIKITNYFTEHFAFFFGVLDVDSIVQMIGRVRDVNVPKYIWVKQFVKAEYGLTADKEINIAKFQAARYQNVMAELAKVHQGDNDLKEKMAAIEAIYQKNIDAHSVAADKIKSIWNYEKPNLRECVKSILIENNYQLESIVADDSFKASLELVKDAKTAVKEQNAFDIFNASDRRIGDNDLSLNNLASWEKRCEVLKAWIVKTLPRINETEIWSPDFIKLIKYDRPNLVKQLNQFYLLKNPGIAKKIAADAYHRQVVRDNNGERIPPWKQRQQYLRIQTAIDVGFLNIINNNNEFYTANHNAIATLVDKCKKPEVSAILGKPGKSPMKYIGNILRSFGVDWREVYPRIDGKKCRGYKVSLKSITKTEYQAILNAIAIKYEKYSDSVWLKPQWDLSQGETPPQEKSPLTQTEKGIEPATLQHLNVYNQEGQSVAHEELADLENQQSAQTEEKTSLDQTEKGIEPATLQHLNVYNQEGQSVAHEELADLENQQSAQTEENKQQTESQFILGLLKDLENRRDDVEIERSLYLNYPSVQNLSVDEDLSISNQLISPRFKTTTQIEELLSLEFEQRIIAVEKEILSVCPDFYSRWMNALVPLLEELPEAIDTDCKVKEYFARIYDNQDAIAEIAQMLSKIENSSDLLDLTQQEFYSRDRFNKAARLLPKNKQEELRAIADELDRSRDKNRACSYLERCQRVAGKIVLAAVNNAGKMLSSLGRFISLEIVGERCMARVIIDGISHYLEPDQLKFSKN